MDFIEKWFGIAPDNGNGMFELSLIGSILALVAVAIIFYVRRSRRLKRKEAELRDVTVANKP